MDISSYPELNDCSCTCDNTLITITVFVLGALSGLFILLIYNIGQLRELNAIINRKYKTASKLYQKQKSKKKRKRLKAKSVSICQDTQPISVCCSHKQLSLITSDEEEKQVLLSIQQNIFSF